MINYIYGELCKAVEKVTYEGKDSVTANVVIDNDNNTIQVNVTNVPASLLNPNTSVIDENGRYILISEVNNGTITYRWATIENFIQEYEDRYNYLVQTDKNLSDAIVTTNKNVADGFNAINKNMADGFNTINGGIATEIQERKDADTALRNDLNQEIEDRKTAITNEENRVNTMINQLNENVNGELVQLNQNLVDAINTINGGIEEERQTRATADETLQSNVEAEATERKNVDQHLWDILPDNIIAGTPMQGMENGNAVNIVFSKYQKHGIGEDPADAEYIEMSNQAITLFPATQEVAGVLTAADKTKIDNIATDIGTAVQAEAEARQGADTQLGNRITAIEDTGVLNSELTGNGKLSINIQSEAGRTFNIEAVDTSDAGNDNRFTLTLDNNDSISGKKLDNTSVPLVFMSKWDKVEVGGSDAPLNLNSNDGKVTVNDTYTLLDNTDKTQLEQGIETAVSAEQTRAETAEEELSNSIEQEITRATNKENSIDEDLQSFKSATNNSIVQIENDLATEGNRITTLDNNTVKKTGQSNQIIEGNVSIQGNLTVDGTTTTNDTETLVIQDNLIITNGGGVELTTSMSGLGIKTNATNAFGVVYDPSVSELKAGIGVISESNAFSFSEGEGNPVTLRSSDNLITDGNILRWDGTGRKLVDSGVPYAQIARKDSEQIFIGTQTFVNGISVTVGDVDVAENISANNIVIDNSVSATRVTATGDITGGSIKSNSSVTTTDISVSNSATVNTINAGTIIADEILGNSLRTTKNLIYAEENGSGYTVLANISLPETDGTMALTSDVQAETTRATAVEANKVDKLTTTDSDRVYVHLTDGTESSMVVSVTNVPNSIVRRFDNNCIDVGTPVEDSNAANKGYTDNAITTAVATEAGIRENADNTLQGNIDTEAINRAGADNQLQANINAEANIRAGEDNNLQEQITNHINNHNNPHQLPTGTVLFTVNNEPCGSVEVYKEDGDETINIVSPAPTTSELSITVDGTTIAANVYAPDDISMTFDTPSLSTGTISVVRGSSPTSATVYTPNGDQTITVANPPEKTITCGANSFTVYAPNGTDFTLVIDDGVL